MCFFYCHVLFRLNMCMCLCVCCKFKCLLCVNCVCVFTLIAFTRLSLSRVSEWKCQCKRVHLQFQWTMHLASSLTHCVQLTLVKWVKRSHIQCKSFVNKCHLNERKWKRVRWIENRCKETKLMYISWGIIGNTFTCPQSVVSCFF